MDILIYNELNISRVKKQYDKIIDMIRRDDFYSQKLKNSLELLISELN